MNSRKTALPGSFRQCPVAGGLTETTHRGYFLEIRCILSRTVEALLN